MSTRLAIYLAFKEVWRSRSRYFLISLVIALITLLVLFLAGLGEGLGAANREYLSKIDADLILFQEKADRSVIASQLGNSVMNDINRTPGIAQAAAIGYSGVFVQLDDAEEPLAISLLGVEPDKPGNMEIVDGRSLGSLRANEVVIDSNVVRQTGLGLGDTLTIESTQGAVDEIYELEIVGISSGQQFFFQPSITVPLYTWDRIRPQPSAPSSSSELVFNIVAIKLADGVTQEQAIANLQNRVDDIDVTDVVTAYESSPGYAEQQTTVNTQRGFTLLIGILVVGGFFQIQTLQKIAQIGMLKALGASNRIVSIAATMQIVLTNLFGVFLGGTATLLLAPGLPAGIPISFVGTQMLIAVVTLLLIGPIGGLVSIRLALKVEPLTALGLAS